MGSDSGGLLIFMANYGKYERAQRIFDYGSGSLTLAITNTLIGEGASTLALLVDDDERIQYVGVVTGGTRATDMQRKVQIGPVLKLSPVGLRSLAKQLPSSIRRHFAWERGSTTRIPPVTWSHALDTALQLSEQDQGSLRPLVEVIESRSSVSRARLLEVVAFERDAIATLLEVYSGSNLRRAVINSTAATNDAPFIKRLKHGSVHVVEDQMIQHDILSFPGASDIMSDVVGAVRMKTTSGALTVINANRTKIERTLGVDLVYYNEARDSFVMVQYKRMEGKDDPAFYPKADRNLTHELARMRQRRRETREALTSLRRLPAVAQPFLPEALLGSLER